MASASYHISNLLEKMTSSDKDFRCGVKGDGEHCRTTGVTIVGLEAAGMGDEVSF